MKLEFLKKANIKIIAIAAAAVLVIGGGTAIALSAVAANSRNSEISEQEAKAAVFAHAGISEQDILSLRVSKGTENGSPVYEIEFQTAEKKYDYDVARNSGEILNSSYDTLGKEDVQSSDNTSAQTSTSSAAPDDGTDVGSASGAQSQASAASNSSQSASAVTKDQAKSIALEDAGVTESATQFLWVKEDFDNGRAVFDVEFYANGTEYDYEIEQSTGRIISSDFDIESYSPNSSSQNNNANSSGIITTDEACSIVLAKVPGATTNDIRIHLDRDDGRQIYEGEIYYSQMEYEFEIDASTGNIIEWSSEHWD